MFSIVHNNKSLVFDSKFNQYNQTKIENLSSQFQIENCDDIVSQIITKIIMNCVIGHTEDEITVIVEHVNAMPGQGVTSMFNFGQSFGVIKGVCSALSLPIYFIRTTKWKKHFNLINVNKDASRTKAIEIYPEISNKLSRKKDSNRADAILIARYFNDTKV